MISPLNIYQQLEVEHKEILKLLKKTQQASSQDRMDCLLDLEKVIFPHMKAEEQVLYSKVRKRAMKEHREEDIALTNQSIEEHRNIKNLISELKEISVDDNAWSIKLNELKSNFSYHANKEEDEFFDVCMDNLTPGEQEHLLRFYNEAKEKFVATTDFTHNAIAR